MVMSVPWLNYPLTIEALTGGGAGGGGGRNKLACSLNSAVGNVSGYRYVSDCRSRGCELDPSSDPYFRGD